MEVTKINEEWFTKQVAETILQQVKNWGDISVYWSWGVDKLFRCEFDGKSGMMMRVHGFKLEGWVIILLNEGSDTYEIYTQKGKLFNLAKVQFAKDDVYCDELQNIVDRLVETGDMTEDQYSKKVEEHYATTQAD